MFCLFLLFASAFKTVFLGTLRDVEIEHLTDKIWTTMMDALLIMTIFRDEFTTNFVSLFVVFLFMKTFHWLAQDRVDYVRYSFAQF
jgi:E3 ubiquitin-protein ligase synoviolin